MTRILVTGATGFTGRYLAPKLASAGLEVHGTAHGESDGAPDGVACLHEVDLGDSDAVARLVADVVPDRVVHLAAVSFVAHADVGEMYRTNVVGTRNLLEGLAGSGKRPATVLLASSANIYGNARGGMIGESVSPAPVNDYGVSKAASELVAGAYRERLPIIVVRPFNYTGRGQSHRFLIPKIVAHLREGASEIELGNLDVARDFSDVRGVVDAYSRLLDTPDAIGGTFNICSGRATTLRELLDIAQRIAGRELEVTVNPDLVRKNEVQSLWGSAARLEAAIGPLSMPPLEDTLSWMLDE